jgi:hypothetical protein
MNGKKKYVKLYKVDGKLINQVIDEKRLMDKVSKSCCLTADFISKLNRPSYYLFLPDLLKLVEVINDERILFEKIVIGDRYAIYPMHKYMINGQHFEYWRREILHYSQSWMSYKSGYSQIVISHNENNKRSMNQVELEDWISATNTSEEFLTDIGPVYVTSEEDYTLTRYTKEEIQREKMANRLIEKLYSMSLDELQNLNDYTDNLRRSRDHEEENKNVRS